MSVTSAAGDPLFIVEQIPPMVDSSKRYSAIRQLEASAQSSEGQRGPNKKTLFVSDERHDPRVVLDKTSSLQSIYTAFGK